MRYGNVQVGELAGIAVGATVMLNILIAGYVAFSIIIVIILLVIKKVC